MDPKQKKKWEEKLAKAKSDDKKTSSPLSTGRSANPDLNAIRKRYLAEKEDNTPAEDIPLEPDQSVEDDIEVEVKSAKPKSGSDADNDLTSKKIIIKSKSKGTLGFNG
jgi:hypothetical protein